MDQDTHRNMGYIAGMPAPALTEPEPDQAAAQQALRWESGYWSAPRKPQRSGSGRFLVLAGLAVAVLGGGAYGVDAYAERAVCTDVAALGDVSAAPASTADSMRAYSRVLMFNDDLQTAADGLAGDLGRLADERKQVVAGVEVESVLVVQRDSLLASFDTHVRQAQQACDVPVTGAPAEGRPS